MPAPDPNPLKAQLLKASADMHAALADFGFQPESFDSIITQTLDRAARLRAAHAPAAADRLESLCAEFRDALALSADPDARGRAYLALLESTLIGVNASEAAGPRWLAALDRHCASLSEPSATPTAGGLTLLTVAQMCIDIGAKATPPAGGMVRIEWQGWRLALVPAAAETPDQIAPAVARAADVLRSARTPGLIVLDLSQPVCPERRALRAVHPDDGAAELRARLDRLLQDAKPGIKASANLDHALGVIGCAFLSLHLVAAAQVAFITAYRFMSLLDPADPREHKLARFRVRFGDL